jgi:hypothetical protein
MYIVHTSRVALFVPFQAISLMTYTALYFILEWPALWRITMNSLHNEGIYKRVN